jgi:hypothetical protein
MTCWTACWAWISFRAFDAVTLLPCPKNTLEMKEHETLTQNTPLHMRRPRQLQHRTLFTYLCECTWSRPCKQQQSQRTTGQESHVHIMHTGHMPYFANRIPANVLHPLFREENLPVHVTPQTQTHTHTHTHTHMPDRVLGRRIRGIGRSENCSKSKAAGRFRHFRAMIADLDLVV